MALLYRVLDSLVYFEPTACCDMPSDFLLAPLPGKKQLWEASDEFEWTREHQRQPNLQETHALTAGGDIVRLDSDRLSCGDTWLSRTFSDNEKRSKLSGGWIEWCAGMDGQGWLVLLAASLAMQSEQSM